MVSHTCQAIVLSTRDYGESDRIVSLFTLEYGRLKAFSKSARASRRRFGGSLEPAHRLELALKYKDEGLCRLERVEATWSYPGLRQTLETLTMALYGCELVEALTPEGHPLPRLFRLLSALLAHLDQGGATEADRRFFEVNLLNILGYRPPLDDDRLRPLQNCLRTGKFGLIKFSEQELTAAGRLLDTAIKSHATRPIHTLTFLKDLIKPGK